MSEVAKKEDQKDDQKDEFEVKLLDMVTIGIVSTSLLLASTLLASGFFGIPEFITLRIQTYKFKTVGLIPRRIETILAILFYIFGFIFIQLYDASKYILFMFQQIVYAITNTDISAFRDTFKDSAQKNALKSVISLAAASCWCLSIYNNVQKKKLIEHEAKKLK